MIPPNELRSGIVVYQIKVLKELALNFGALLSNVFFLFALFLSGNEEGVTERKDTNNEDTDSGAMMT
jgi:hypothetical protein|eukprot:scaffold758_cov195-Alexandrium_tamarense.AAC.2